VRQWLIEQHDHDRFEVHGPGFRSTTDASSVEEAMKIVRRKRNGERVVLVETDGYRRTLIAAGVP
jgi:hypothetical protein